MSDLAIDPLVATATAVTMTLVDAANNSWVGAKVIVTFVAAPNTSSPYLWNGATFQMNYYYENIGNTNIFSISLPSNLDISPRGDLSFWRFDVAPNIDDMRSVSFTVQISTAAIDLSAAFKFASQNLVQFPVQSIPVPRATGDTAVAFTPNDGQLYFDITLQKLKVWSGVGNSWLALDTGTASGMVYPPAGLAVSTSTAWGTSLDPNNSYLKLTGGTLIGNTGFNPGIQEIFGSSYNYFMAANAYDFYMNAWRFYLRSSEQGNTIVMQMDDSANITFGTLVYLHADPTTALQAATKQYVDNHIASAAYLPLAGGVTTGNIQMNGNSYLSFNGTAAAEFPTVYATGSNNYLALYGYLGIELQCGSGYTTIMTITTTGISTLQPITVGGGGISASGAIYTSGATGNLAGTSVAGISESTNTCYFDSLGNATTLGTFAWRAAEANGVGVVTIGTFTSTGFYASGTISSGGAKTFRIDHPTKPSYELVHACIEGPEAAVYYRGEDITDEFGMCEITLPDYFEALVRPQGRTVQVTPIFEDDDEEFSSMAAGRVLAGRFKVRSTLVDQKFYWEVKAIRADVPELEVEVAKAN